MALPDWAALGPALWLAFGALLVLLVDSVDPDSSHHGVLAGVAGVSALGSVGTAIFYLLAGTGLPAEESTAGFVPAGRGIITLFDGTLVVDQLALFFAVIIASVVGFVVVASVDYLGDHSYKAEYYALVLLAATGMTLLGMANSLATAFVALELASLPSFALVAFLKTNEGSVEAGLKYFLVGALSSAVLAYGISLVYVATGALQFGAVAEAVGAGVPTPILGVGVLFIIGGIAYKTASSPFHFWAPEAYEGAPAPISAFLSSASKAAGFVFAFRAFSVAFPIEAVGGSLDWVLALQVLAVVTMFVGNFAAARQERVKRMLAYSSVGHAGYVLIGLAAITGTASDAYVLGAGMTHLLIYGFMNTGAFLFVALAEYWEVGRTFSDYNGLGSRAPVACTAMTIFLFSLAGLPVGGGILSKVYLLSATVESGTVLLLGGALIVNSALSVYYYSRVVKAMWIEDPDDGLSLEGFPTGLYTAVVLTGILTVLTIPGFGIITTFAQSAAGLIV